MSSFDSILEELKDHEDKNGNVIKGLNIDELRMKYIKQLSSITGRNVITYYSGFLKEGRNHCISIEDIDMEGFIDVVENLDVSKGLDLILHTPGGNPTAAEGIVKFLHAKFKNDIRVIVPHMAMSAGTMIACSAKEIIMGSYSFLGPTDPQIGGMPAYNIIQEFDEAKKELTKNPNTAPYYQIQLERYPHAIYHYAKDSILISKQFVRQWLEQYMFDGLDLEEKKQKINCILKTLNHNKQPHSEHFDINDCTKMGLNVISLETNKELEDVVLNLHYSYMVSIDMSKATKIIENQFGERYIIMEGN